MRCRNYKSEFFKSEDISELSFVGRLLFLGLISLADRRGVLAYKPRRIRAEVFPYDDVTSEDVEACVQVMCAHKMASVYRCGDDVLLHITNFEKHQSISVKERRQCNLNGPLPTDEGCELVEGCGVVGVRFGCRDGVERFWNGSGTVLEHLKSEIGNLKSEGGVGDDGVAGAPPSGDELFDDSDFGAAAGADKPRGKGPTAPGIALVAGELCGVTEVDLARWEAAAPGVDVAGELLRAASWLVENPKRMKKNLRAFLGNWIRREGQRVAERAAAAGGSVAGLGEKPKAWKGFS